MAKVENNAPTSRLSYLNHFQLERGFVIFSLIYLPVAILFLNRGIFAESLLFVYTLLLGIAALLLIGKFFLLLAKAANRHSGNMGDILVVYLVDFLVPVLVLKAITYVSLLLVPTGNGGILCDIRHFVYEMNAILQVQHNLSTVALVSAFLMFAFTLWSVRSER